MLGRGNLTHLVCDLNDNQFSPIDRLLPAAGFQGCAPGRATSTRGRLPGVCRDEDVDLRSVLEPPVLVAFERFAGRGPTHLDQRAREPAEDVRSGPNVEDGVGVLGWTVRRESTLGAVQMHHLPPDQTQEGPRRAQSSNSARQARS